MSDQEAELIQGFEEDQQDQLDFQQEYNEDQAFGQHPIQKMRETIFSFFNNILRIKNSQKVGNLDKWELGKLDMSVRNLEYLSLVSEHMHNRAATLFFRKKSEIVLATSLSKKAYLIDAVITQKRSSTRIVQSNSQPTNGKPSFLSFGNKPNTNAEVQQ